jgi:hypothetical protein
MKSHKGSQKRIGVTGSGKPIRVKSWRYAGKTLIGPEHADQVARLLPYLKKG